MLPIIWYAVCDRYSDDIPSNIVELEAQELNGKISFKPNGQFFPLTNYGGSSVFRGLCSSCNC